MGGKFHAGQTNPNPGGKTKEEKKAVSQVKELARKHTKDAIKALHGIAMDPKGEKRARVAASIALLDRGYGRPTPVADGGGGIVGGRLIIDLTGRNRTETKSDNDDAESDTSGQ